MSSPVEGSLMDCGGLSMYGVHEFDLLKTQQPSVAGSGLTSPNARSRQNRATKLKSEKHDDHLKSL